MENTTKDGWVFAVLFFVKRPPGYVNRPRMCGQHKKEPLSREIKI